MLSLLKQIPLENNLLDEVLEVDQAAFHINQSAFQKDQQGVPQSKQTAL